mmetsp:Transcript_1514/g.4978  ORF Transcript_1514/g.4978 Transcript_1514/m.4978 type:complete len:235 (-) Transcript_1514:36-740(-)
MLLTPTEEAGHFAPTDWLRSRLVVGPSTLRAVRRAAEQLQAKIDARVGGDDHHGQRGEQQAACKHGSERRTRIGLRRVDKLILEVHAGWRLGRRVVHQLPTHVRDLVARVLEREHELCQVLAAPVGDRDPRSLKLLVEEREGHLVLRRARHALIGGDEIRRQREQRDDARPLEARARLVRHLAPLGTLAAELAALHHGQQVARVKARRRRRAARTPPEREREHHAQRDTQRHRR